MEELAEKIVREYYETRPDFYKIADWGKELADMVLEQCNKKRLLEIG